MPCYLVTYDLNSPGQDYNSLIQTLEQKFHATKVLKSTWLVTTSGTATDLAYEISKLMDGTDGLFVAECRLGCVAVNTENTESIIEQKLRGQIR